MILVGGFSGIGATCYPSEQPSQDKMRPSPRQLRANDMNHSCRVGGVQRAPASECVEEKVGLAAIDPPTPLRPIGLSGKMDCGKHRFWTGGGVVRWAMPFGDIKTGKLLRKHPLPAGRVLGCGHRPQRPGVGQPPRRPLLLPSRQRLIRRGKEIA